MCLRILCKLERIQLDDWSPIACVRLFDVDDTLRSGILAIDVHLEQAVQHSLQLANCEAMVACGHGREGEA